VLAYAPPSGRVEVDESYVGGNEEGAMGRETATKAPVAIAVELHEPKGIGRIRLQHVPDVSKASLIAFVQASVEPGSTVHTDGWQAYWTLPDHGYTHDRVVVRRGEDPSPSRSLIGSYSSNRGPSAATPPHPADHAATPPPWLYRPPSDPGARST
jgi:transposase-like protein